MQNEQKENSMKDEKLVDVTCTKPLTVEISNFAIVKMIAPNGEVSYKLSHDCWEVWEDMERFSKREVINFLKDFLRNYKKCSR